MELSWKNFKLIIFILAIIAGCAIQVLMYLIPPLSGDAGFNLQTIYMTLFYLPILVILLTFPRPKSINKQILALNILVLCLILASMNVDFQVLRIFSLGDAPPPNIGDLVWDKTNNLYWIAWMFQMSIAFLVFGLIYRFRKNDTWTAFRIGAVGPLISLFSFEDIIYYPMHGEIPAPDMQWTWLPQHDFYFGRSVTTIELIWIVTIAMIAIFLFLVIPALIKNPKSEPIEASFSEPKEKGLFQWFIPIILGVSLGLVFLYLNTNIIGNQIPFYLLLLTLAVIGIFIIFSSNFPKIKSTVRQLIIIFGCYILFWIAATEMDWHAVEAGFHWIVPSDPRKPPGDFWVWCDYRMAMWLIFIPVVILLISVFFKLIGNSKQATYKLGITNFLLMFIAIDSILIFFIAGLVFPSNWIWSNIHYSIFNGFYSIPILIGFLSIITIVFLYVHKRIKLKNDEPPE